MNRFTVLLALVIAAIETAAGDVTLSGDLTQWHKVTLTLDGPFAGERHTQFVRIQAGSSSAPQLIRATLTLKDRVLPGQVPITLKPPPLSKSAKKK